MSTITVPLIASKLGWRAYEGSEFLWSCYGPNCRYIDFRNSEYDWESWQISVIFDTKTLSIREITGYGEIWESTEKTPWMWRDPNFTKEYLDECNTRNVAPNIAWDNVVYHILPDEFDVIKMVDMVADNANQ